MDHLDHQELRAPSDHKVTPDRPESPVRRVTVVRTDATVFPERRVFPDPRVVTSWFRSVSRPREARRDQERTLPPKSRPS